MPDPNQSNTTDNSSQTTASGIPPISPQAPEDVPVVPAFQQPTSDQMGSAAPVNFPTDMSVSSPKKKFGGGKIIATILGLVVLIGGVGAGILLTQQQQVLTPKAVGPGACACKDADTGEDRGGSCNADGSCSCPAGTNPGANRCSENPGGGGDQPNATTPGNCSNQQKTDGWSQCGDGTGGANCTFCLRATTQTCNDVLRERQCGTTTGTQCQNVSSPVNVYYCEGKTTDLAGGCQDTDPLPPGVGWNSTTKRIEGSFCGAIQVDEINGSDICSKIDTSACQGGGGGGNNSAQCQNVKAYSSTWAPLTTAQLSALSAGANINFCVTGSSTSGSFDKARFTINGAARGETTNKRPGSQDFCEGYTLPAGVTQFNVSAQIHHASLGWK